MVHNGVPYRKLVYELGHLSLYSWVNFFGSLHPSILCAKTAPKHPVLEAASTQRYLTASSRIKLQNNGSCISLFFIISKAFRCSSLISKSTVLLELVRGVSTCICLITSNGITRLILFTNPRKLLTSFLEFGN